MPDDTTVPDTTAPDPIEVLRAAAEGARQENAGLAVVVEAISADVRVRNAQTGADLVVGRAAAPFFTNQGYELVDEPVADPETPGRHEGT